MLDVVVLELEDPLTVCDCVAPWVTAVDNVEVRVTLAPKFAR